MSTSRLAIVAPPVLCSLCVVHCVALAVLAPLAPALTAALDSRTAEWVGAAISVAAAPWTLPPWSGRARIRVAAVALVAAGAAAYGLLRHDELATTAGLLGLAALQAASSARRLRALRPGTRRPGPAAARH